MRMITKAMAILTWLVLLPNVVSAQAVITGVVKDASGAILPGVTVEAASPALIEKVRAAVTDGTGQYRIENLRPGSYSVTFSLQGFSGVKREGIELTGSFIATVDADLKVGVVSETVSVSGESPIVDVQSAKRETTIDNDVIRAIPNTRNYNSMVVLVPGVITNVNDIGTGIVTTQFPIHGGRANESRMTVDGLNVGNPPGGGQPPTYVADIGNAQEVAFTTSGNLGEAETAGLVMNIVPKTGGNAVHGAVYFSGSGENLQADNGTGSPINDIYDLNGSDGRTDHEGSDLVLRERTDAGKHQNHPRGVLQPQRRRSGRLALRARHQPSGVYRSHVGEPERPRHLAGDATEQGGWFLG